jgi:hypothetical protein
MAISTRQSSENLFSISAASEILRRSRRTIAHALQGVRPSAIKSGLKLWTMQTIIDAVNNNTQAPILTKHRDGNGSVVVMTGVAAETEAAFERYHAAEAAMCALPTLAARRGAAHELVLIAKEALELMHDRDVEADLHPEHLELKNQAVTLLVIRGLESACEWPHSQAWDCFNGPDVEDGEAA